jgi:hypothetical protein
VGGDLSLLVAPVMTSTLGGGPVLRPSSEVPDALKMELELLRLVVVPQWLRRPDPDPPGVLRLEGVAGLVP